MAAKKKAKRARKNPELGHGLGEYAIRVLGELHDAEARGVARPRDYYPAPVVADLKKRGLIKVGRGFDAPVALTDKGRELAGPAANANANKQAAAAAVRVEYLGAASAGPNGPRVSIRADSSRDAVAMAQAFMLANPPHELHGAGGHVYVFPRTFVGGMRREDGPNVYQASGKGGRWSVEIQP